MLWFQFITSVIDTILFIHKWIVTVNIFFVILSKWSIVMKMALSLVFNTPINASLHLLGTSKAWLILTFIIFSIQVAITLFPGMTLKSFVHIFYSLPSITRDDLNSPSRFLTHICLSSFRGEHFSDCKIQSVEASCVNDYLDIFLCFWKSIK